MSASRLQLARLISDTLAQCPTSLPIVPVGYTYAPRFDLQQAPPRQVTVVPGDVRQPGPIGRGGGPITEEVDCDLCLQARVSSADPAEIDPLVELLQELQDHFRRSPRLGPFQFVKSESLIGEEHLQQRRVFTGLITLTYRITRD